MNAAEKPTLRAANDNPWYCLATLHGEQPIDGWDPDLAEKNREAWNRWSGDITEDERAGYVPAFTRRTMGKTSMMPERAEYPDFSRTHFERAVSFEGFHFHDYADFRSATFSAAADFSQTEFNHHNADFNSTTFSAKANFRSAVFKRRALFGMATFSDEADFSEARFFGLDEFGSAMFFDAARFGSTTFFGTVSFDCVTFAGWADFRRVMFSGMSHFAGAVFLYTADFVSGTFSEEANFYGVVFCDHVRFCNAKFTSNTSFADVRFHSRVPDFRGATLHEATEWHGATWPRPPARELPTPGNTSSAQEQVYSYERLKQEMERLKKHEDEQNFFRMELRARRGLVRTLSGSWLLNFIYQVLSGYGTSISRPLGWLFGLFVIGIAIFARAPLYCGAPMPIKLAAKLSFANIFVFLPDKREIMMTGKMVECLSNTTQAVSAAQSLLGVVLLFLLGLALRNRFRMK
jgi:hypothetical protein